MAGLLILLIGVLAASAANAELLYRAEPVAGVTAEGARASAEWGNASK